MALLKQLTIYIFFISLLTACGKESIRGEVLDSSVITNPKEIVITDNIIEVSVSRYELEKTHTNMLILERGLYKSKYKTSKGVFYEGTPHSIVWELEDGSVFRNTGGFFVPYMLNQPVRWWKDRGSTKIWDKEEKPINILAGKVAFTNGNIDNSTFSRSGIFIGQKFTAKNSHHIRSLVK